jgi:hypothetical protein
MMGGLLNLPSELLFEIIDLVITSIHWPEESVRYRPIRDTCLFPRNLYCVPGLKLTGQHPALHLLRTCRKLYSETQVLDLDVAIVNDHWIWPTWRNLPVRKDGAFDKINVHFVLCCTENERSLQADWNKDFIVGACKSTDDGRSLAKTYLNWRALNPLHNLVGNENIDASIANTLSDFLNQPFSGKAIGSPVIFRTETLAFHVDTSIYGDDNRLLGQSEVPIRKVNGLGHLDFKQLYPANAERTKFFLKDVQDYIETWFQEWKEMEQASPRVGKILFCVDGVTVRALDPTQYAVGHTGE